MSWRSPIRRSSLPEGTIPILSSFPRRGGPFSRRAFCRYTHFECIGIYEPADGKAMFALLYNQPQALLFPFSFLFLVAAHQRLEIATHQPLEIPDGLAMALVV